MLLRLGGRRFPTGMGIGDNRNIISIIVVVLYVCGFKDLDSVLHLGYDDLYLLDRRGHAGLRSFPVTAAGLLVVTLRNLGPISIVRGVLGYPVTVQFCSGTGYFGRRLLSY